MKWTEIAELLLHLIDTIASIVGIAIALKEKKRKPKHRKQLHGSPAEGATPFSLNHKSMSAKLFYSIIAVLTGITALYEAFIMHSTPKTIIWTAICIVWIIAAVLKKDKTQ